MYSMCSGRGQELIIGGAGPQAGEAGAAVGAAAAAAVRRLARTARHLLRTGQVRYFIFTIY